jgi:2'-5' RNA ligase
MSRARLFLALEPGEAARSALATWRDEVLGGRSELRLLPPESLHVTLVFLGGRAEAEIPAIARAGLSALTGLAAPVLCARGVVGVPRRRPRLLALDLDDREGRARDVAATVAGALAAAGMHEPEARPFWAHLTLARVRSRGAGGGAADGPLPAYPQIPMSFDRVTLYRSHPSSAGARYEAIERRRLVLSS